MNLRKIDSLMNLYAYLFGKQWQIKKYIGTYLRLRARAADIPEKEAKVVSDGVKDSILPRMNGVVLDLIKKGDIFKYTYNPTIVAFMGRYGINGSALTAIVESVISEIPGWLAIGERDRPVPDYDFSHLMLDVDDQRQAANSAFRDMLVQQLIVHNRVTEWLKTFIKLSNLTDNKTRDMVRMIEEREKLFA